MNRELPNERLGRGGDWQRVIIPIDVGTPHGRNRWLHWTHVTHEAGGKVTLYSRGAPPEGWREHWRRYRAKHPELEPMWDESSAVYPTWGSP